MLSILGLLGLVMAGVAADAVLSGPDNRDEDDDTPPDPEGEGEGGNGSLLDDIDQNDTADVPLSDDLDDPLAESETVTGSDKGDILSGGNADDRIDGMAGDDLIDGLVRLMATRAEVTGPVLDRD